MKHPFAIFIAVIMILFTGCGDSGTAEEQRGTPRDGNAGSRPRLERTAAGGESTGRGSREADGDMRDSGSQEFRRQPAEGEKSVTGVVKTIVGNEVTLAIPAENGEEATATYLLPVGMKIGNQDFSSVSIGNTLNISFGTHPDDGAEIITSVSIVGSR